MMLYFLIVCVVVRFIFYCCCPLEVGVCSSRDLMCYNQSYQVSNHYSGD